MLTTPHSLTGATIAVLIPNPIISVPFAVGSHFILDSIPHWQETLYPYKPHKGTWIRVSLDVALSFGLVWWITQSHSDISAVIWLTAFAANVPDFDFIVVLIPKLLGFKLLKSFWDWHCKIQRETSSLWGLVPQIILFIACLMISLPLNLSS